MSEPNTFLVKATKGLDAGVLVGYYGDMKRREGDEFELSDPSHFSSHWMEAMGWDPTNTEPPVEVTPPTGRKKK